jgi:hypothetical protein
MNTTETPSTARIKIKMVEIVNDHKYQDDAGRTMTREYGLTPNGNQLNGRWVLRDQKGQWIDMDKYRFDLSERHDIQLVSKDGIEPA